MQAIDFDGLLNDLFQENVPVREKVQECQKPQKNCADFSKALGEIFRSDVNHDTVESHGSNEADISPLPACSLYVFMRKIIMEHFGMGYDYAIINREGTLLKSWFTIPEAIETAEKQGYRLSVTECKAYLDRLINKRYIETDGYKYRRCAFWDKHMEAYLLRYSVSAT